MASKLSAAQIKARLANPGERSKLPARYLTPAQRQQRDLNARLNSPVTQGSSMTNRDLAHQASNATQLQYGQTEQAVNSNIAARQQTERDAASWYDQYQKDLLQHAQNVKNAGSQVTQNLTGLTGVAGGLSAPGGTGTADDANAARVRAALTGSFAALANQTSGNANTYADTQANVVAPGQKLSGLMSARDQTQAVRDKLSALQADKSAFNQKFRSDAVAGEAKNVLAEQALGLNATKAQTAAQAAAARISETARHNKAAEKAAGQSVNSYGYSKADWAAKTPAERQKIMKNFKLSTTKPKTAKSPYLGTSQQTSFQNDFKGAQSVVSDLKLHKHYSRLELRRLLQKGRPATTLIVDPKTYDVVPAGTKGAVRIQRPAVPKITNDVALQAALDAVYDGHLSPATIKRLHQAGIKANALGVSTKRPDRATQLTNQAISSVGTAVQGAVQALPQLVN